MFFLVSVCLQLSWASEDLSDKPIIDEEFRAVEIEIKKVTEECRGKEKNVIKRLKCGEAYWKLCEKEGKLRGTDEYCRKHYGKLDTEQLRALWEELKGQRRRARINPDEDIPGEVTEVMLKIEESWVEDQLAQRQKAKIKNLEKEVYKKTE